MVPLLLMFILKTWNFIQCMKKFINPSFSLQNYPRISKARMGHGLGKGA